MIEKSLQDRCRSIKMIILDVDGVMTDGRTYINEDGTESKRFDLKDGFGIVMAKNCNLGLAVITGSKSNIIIHRTRQLGIEEVHFSFRDKDVILNSIMETHNLKGSEIAYMGDDLYDLPVIRLVGLSGSPADAASEVKQEVDWVSAKKGGEGAVREFIELILKSNGSWEQAYAEFAKS